MQSTDHEPHPTTCSTTPAGRTKGKNPKSVAETARPPSPKKKKNQTKELCNGEEKKQNKTKTQQKPTQPQSPPSSSNPPQKCEGEDNKTQMRGSRGPGTKSTKEPGVPSRSAESPRISTAGGQRAAPSTAHSNRGGMRGWGGVRWGSLGAVRIWGAARGWQPAPHGRDVRGPIGGRTWGETELRGRHRPQGIKGGRRG